MAPSDRKPFATALLALAELYGKEVSEAVTGMWWDALVRYDLAAIKEAMGKHVQSPDTGQFMPKPADVVRMIDGSSSDAALLAWAKVDRAVRSVGTYASVAFDDALIHRVLHDMGGWIPLGTKTEDEWPFVRNEFVNRYRGFRSTAQAPEYPATLVGIAQSQNGGRYDTPVTLVGDAEKARAVAGLGATQPLLHVLRVAALPYREDPR